MSKELDTTGRAAQVHLKELQLCQDKTKGYHARRIEATERLRPMLKKIWTALENGETVNSYNTKEMWAKWFNPGAKGTNAMRQIQRIIADPKEKKATSGRLTLLTRIADAKKKLADIRAQIEAMEEARGTNWKSFVDETEPTINPLFEEFLTLIAPEGYEVLYSGSHWHVQAKYEEPAQTAPAPVTHAKYSARKTLCMANMPNRKLKGKVFAENWDAATCPDCLQYNERKKTQLAPSLSPSGRNYRKERAAKKVTVQQARRKTHQMQPGDHRTWCGKTPGLTLKKDAPMSDDPTCRQCQLGKHMDKSRKEAVDNHDKYIAQQTVEHTGQHEDCSECFEAWQAKEELDKTLSAATEQWRKRLQTLINTWRNGRLRGADKYRMEFDKASEKYEKKVKRIISKTKATVEVHQLNTGSIVKEARGRMEGAIADRERLEALHPAAKALAAAEKANKRSKGTNITPAARAATTGLVKMARIGNTDEFGVFPESCWKCTTANALTIGTRQECEAERDRINAKRPAKNDSVENLVAYGDAHQNEQQHPAAEALEEALDSTESVEVSDEQHDEEQCSYSEEQVAAMFVQGGD